MNKEIIFENNILTELAREIKFVNDVLDELVKARAKFPGDRVTFIALAEEHGELAKAMNKWF